MFEFTSRIEVCRMYHVRCQMPMATLIIALPWPAHDMNREDAALVAREQIIDKIANDRIWLVPEFGHDPTNQRAAAAVPFQIDRPVNVPRAVNLGPTMRASGLLGPNFDESELLL